MMNERATSQEFDEDKDPFISDWKRVRGLIEHEDELIHQRTTWLITITTFLFAGFYAIPGADVDDDLKQFAAWALPVIGLFVSVALKIAIGAAMKQLKRVTGWWNIRKRSDPKDRPESRDDPDHSRHPPIVGLSEPGQWSHDFMIADVLPSLAASLWIFVLGGQLWKYLKLKLSFPQVTLSLPQLMLWQWILVVIGFASLVLVWRKSVKAWSVGRKARLG